MVKKTLMMAFVLVALLTGRTAVAQTAPCDTVALFPWSENLAAHHDCWTQLGDTSSLWQLNTEYESYFGGPGFGLCAPYNVQADGCAVALPADTVGLHLAFRTRRIGSAVTLRVLVGTGQRDSLSQYDTVYTSTNVSNQQVSIDLAAYDYVVDCIDTVSAKLELARRCHELGTPLLASLGTARKIDPSRLRISDITKTHTDPLAKVMRKKLREMGVAHLKCVWSDELPAPLQQKDSPLPSCIFVPAAAGLLAANHVILSLTGKLS